MMSELPFSESHEFLIERHSFDHAVHLRVRGDVDIATAPLLEQAIATVPPNTSTIVDLSECPYVDSSAISVLVKAHKRFPDEFCVVVPEDARIRRIFSITSLDTVLHIEASADAILMRPQRPGDNRR
jgi:anti-anti-sigma factor